MEADISAEEASEKTMNKRFTTTTIFRFAFAVAVLLVLTAPSLIAQAAPIARVPIAPNPVPAPVPSAQAASAVKPILFEVVSVRISKNDPGGYGFTADGFDGRGIIPAQLIAMAYQFRDINRIPGLQPWCITDRYDVRAKVADADIAAWQKLSPTATSLAL